MSRPAVREEFRDARPSLRQALRASIVFGWVAAAFLTAWIVPHPLLHSEWEEPEWRLTAAEQALALAPFTYFGPLAIAPVAAVVAYRRGWNPPQSIIGTRPGIRFHLAVIMAVLHAFAGSVMLYFLRVLGRV